MYPNKHNNDIFKNRYETELLNVNPFYAVSGCTINEMKKVVNFPVKSFVNLLNIGVTFDALEFYSLKNKILVLMKGKDKLHISEMVETLGVESDMVIKALSELRSAGKVKEV